MIGICRLGGLILGAGLGFGVTAVGCGGDGDEVGSSCEAAEDCFVGLEEELQGGDAMCLDRTEFGYCTHLCANDDDCCAVEGECSADIEQVCAPFESTGMMMCFLSCEEANVDDAGYADADEYCSDLAARDFTCRSTGGGSANRKVCFPPG